ncbi:MAG: RCC1 domain-containing protein, partial [Limisphaerales bacterium]
IRSGDNNHRILLRNSENKMELREYGDLIFSPGATSGAETAKVVMLASGNVGIGTASPSTRLDVAGAITATSATIPTLNGNVGIGTSTPRSALEVNGDIRMSGTRTKLFYKGDLSDGTQTGSMGFYTTNGGATAIMTPYDANGITIANSTVSFGGFGAFESSVVALRTSGNISAPSATIPTAGDYFTLAVKSNGTIAGWGDNSKGQLTPLGGLTGVTAAAGGTNHTVVLKSNGTVVCWGDNTFGQTSVPGGLTGVIAVAAGSYHSVALKSDGTVVAWGLNSQNQTSVPAGLIGVTAIAAGARHTLALKSDRTVVAWGYNATGQSTVPAGLTAVIAIAGGKSHSLAIQGTEYYVDFVAGNDLTGTGGITRPLKTVVKALTLVPSGPYSVIHVKAG